MNKKRYNLRLKSSKIQKITFGIAVGLIILLKLIQLSLDNPSKDTNILFKILISSVAVIGLTIILIDNAKEIKEAKLDQDEEYEIKSYENLKSANSYDEFFKQDVYLDDREYKKKLIFVSLQYACYMGNTTYFYASCSHYSMQEIKEIISTVRITDNLRSFLDSVIFERKETNEIVRYNYEIENIVENLLANIPIDEKLYSDNVYYNNLYSNRAYYVYNEKTKKYEVCSEYYTDHYGYNKWVEQLSRFKYSSKDSAIKKCIKIVNRYNNKKILFIPPCDIDMEWFKSVLLDFLYSNKKLEEPYNTLADYYFKSMKYGHQVYFDMLGDKMVDVLRTLQGLIPEELLDSVARAYNFNTNEEIISLADEKLFEFADELDDILLKYISSYKCKIFE